MWTDHNVTDHEEYGTNLEHVDGRQSFRRLHVTRSEVGMKSMMRETDVDESKVL